MDVIVVSHRRGTTWRLRLPSGRISAWLPVAGVVLALGGLFFSAGWLLRPDDRILPAPVIGAWAQEMQTQRQDIAAARAKAEQDSHALARRIAELQAQFMRLNAAGNRMTQIAKIDAGEFSFDKPTPMGGPEVEAPQATDAQGAGGQSAVLADVIASLDTLEKQMADRERQMRVLEDILLASRLQKEIKPSGWPLDGGYITSGYGGRTDPFSGMNGFHPGVDFASREGSEVLAVASGIVTEADAERSGYGNLIEINHGNGYVTRYGHNSRLLVKPGDRVRKGQAIALMGSTGRSTGPHVHFEVLINGNTVNPEQYIEAAR